MNILEIIGAGSLTAITILAILYTINRVITTKIVLYDEDTGEPVYQMLGLALLIGIHQTD